VAYVEVGDWSGRSYPRGAVVVGYNGRKHSQAALRWAVGEAVRRNAPLLVLYAANYPGMTVEAGTGLYQRDPGALDAAYEVTARGVRDADENHPGLPVVGATEVSSPSQALVEASEHAALIVLGSRGHGRILGALLGSVAFAVTSQAACPVIVVRDTSSQRAVGPHHRVVTGTDGSPESMAALAYAADYARTSAAPLEVVTCTGGHQVADVDEQRLRAAAEQIASSAAALARTQHPELAVTTRVEDCPPEVTLVEASRGAGLVVIGTRGRGAFKGMLLGSVSHAVIHGAECAVAVVDTLGPAGPGPGRPAS